MIKITNFSSLTTGEGVRLTYTFSKVDDVTGSIIQTNIKKSFVVLDTETDLKNSINLITDFILARES